jgi:hypothetical protein
MRVQLSDIKGSTPRVRLSQSPEKLEELAESIREEGMIVPVKVRKNGSGYTLVYGHRRVAAAKMAGLKEIEAIVEDVPDKKLLTQALVENVVREDMTPIEIAKALQGIISDTGCTQEELARKMGWATGESVGHYVEMLAPELGLVSSKQPERVQVSLGHVQQAKAGTDSLKDAGKVLKYAGEKELTRTQTRQVAEVVRKAASFGGQKAVDRVLARPYREIEAAAETLPRAQKPQPKPYEAGKTHFEWLKEPRLGIAEDAIATVSKIVAAMALDNQDRKGAKAALKIIRSRLDTALDQVDRVLREM